MLDAPLFIDITGLIVLLVGASAFVFAYFRSTYSKNTIRQLQELSEALDKRVGALESERDVLIVKVNKLEQENEVLRSLVNGESQFDALLRVIEKNHQEVMVVLGASMQKG